jgi:hypothetical protein
MIPRSTRKKMHLHPSVGPDLHNESIQMYQISADTATSKASRKRGDTSLSGMFSRQFPRIDLVNLKGI